MNLIEKVNKFLKAHNISRDSKILVAFSGGVDSSVLLHLLSQIFPTQQIFAYHVQHMLRSEAESAADLSFCQKFAAQLGVNFSYTRISEGLIESHSKANRCGIEASARHFRYAVISEHVTALDIDYVALGHHLDDNLETVLLRFLSGSSVFGLRGIPPVRDLFIRPMAEISTAEISNYAEENSIGYVVDKSNLDNGFRRNLIRNKIFPYLLESFPGLRTSVHSISKKSSMVADFVDRELARKIAWRQDGESYYIEFPSYLELDEFLKHEILYRGFDFVSRSSGDSKRLPTRFVEESIGRLLREGDKVVGNGIVVEVFLDRLYFYEIGNSLQEKLYFTVDKVFFNKNLNTPFGKIFIKILDKPLKEKEKNVTLIIPTDESLVESELSIRTLQQGDRFFIKGKYRDVFSYLKKSSIPQKIREISYVFEKNGEIILIVVPFKEGKYILSEQSLAFVKNNKYYMYIQILNDGDL